ncbi:hypothetical protein ACOME3_008538 [Neoechinorhynchus agilis]
MRSRSHAMQCLERFMNKMIPYVGAQRVLSFLLLNMGTIPNRSTSDWRHRLSFFNYLNNIASSYTAPFVTDFIRSFIPHGLSDENITIVDATIRLILNAACSIRRFELIRAFHATMAAYGNRHELRSRIKELGEEIGRIYDKEDYEVYVKRFCDIGRNEKTMSKYMYSQKSIAFLPKQIPINLKDNDEIACTDSLTIHSETIGSLNAIPKMERVQPVSIRDVELAFYTIEHESGVRIFETNNDGVAVSADLDCVVKVWNISNIQNRCCIRSLQTFKLNDLMDSNCRINCISFIDRNSFYVGCRRSIISLFNLREDDALIEPDLIRLKSTRVNEAIYPTDICGNLLVTSDSCLNVIDRRTEAKIELVIDLPPEQGEPTCMSAMSDQIVSIGTNLGYVQLCDLRFGIYVNAFCPEKDQSIHRIRHVDQIRTLISSSRCPKAFVIDILQCRLLNTFTSTIPDSSYDWRYLSAIETLSPDSFLIGGTDGRVRLWNSCSPEKSKMIIPNFFDTTEQFNYCEDSADIPNTLESLRLQRKPISVYSCNYQTRHPSKNRFAISSAPIGHSNVVTSIRTIKHDQLNLIATASADHSIRIWRLFD